MLGTVSSIENSTGAGKDGHQPSPSQLFLVRIWSDNDSSKGNGWSGKIQHVLTGESQRFEDADELCALLQAMVDGAESDK